MFPHVSWSCRCRCGHRDWQRADRGDGEYEWEVRRGGARAAECKFHPWGRNSEKRRSVMVYRGIRICIIQQGYVSVGARFASVYPMAVKFSAVTAAIGAAAARYNSCDEPFKVQFVQLPGESGREHRAGEEGMVECFAKYRTLCSTSLPMLLKLYSPFLCCSHRIDKTKGSYVLVQIIISYDSVVD